MVKGHISNKHTLAYQNGCGWRSVLVAYVGGDEIVPGLVEVGKGVRLVVHRGAHRHDHLLQVRFTRVHKVQRLVCGENESHFYHYICMQCACSISYPRAKFHLPKVVPDVNHKNVYQMFAAGKS